ncbi:MAG: hypothetical protein ABJD11_14490 [Gemmatimonadota bacterium]
MKKPQKTRNAEHGARGAGPKDHADGGTRREETPYLEGRDPLPEEITGRASATDESLVGLFQNDSDAHMTDGFQGGSEDVSEGTESRRNTDDEDGADGVTPARQIEPDGTRD